MAERNPNARVDAEQVRDIISTGLTDGQVNAMINTAHLVIEERLGDKRLSASLLGQIELWLAAHYVCMRDPRKKQVKVDDTSVTYQGETGMGLKATSYGQQAMDLDPTGTLASTSMKRASLRAE
jgi:hypothetical protein